MAVKMGGGVIREGVWRTQFNADEDPSESAWTVTLRGAPLPHSRRRIEGDLYELSVPIPREVIEEGTQTVIVADEDGRRLSHFTLIAGEDAGEDLRAELDLLRAELDMLKRAFRRHCVETV